MTKFLPQDSALGTNLKIETIYEYYDRPVLFLCNSDEGNIYLVVLESEEKDFDVWLFVKVSLLRLYDIENNMIDLYTAFKESESGLVILIKNFYNENRFDISDILCDELTDEQLPSRGMNLT